MTTIAISGTGTGVGKTHVACALLIAARARGIRAIGWKPVESGVTGERGEDEAALVDASGDVVAAPTLRLRAPLAPTLAARREGAAIDGDAIRATLAQIGARWPAVVLELAGGLFSPFDDRLDNAEWLARIPHRLVLVAPDRLGVMHDVVAAVRAARSLGLEIHAVALSAPAVPDASTGANAAELRPRVGAPVVEIPRGASDVLARDAGIAALVDRVMS